MPFLVFVLCSLWDVCFFLSWSKWPSAVSNDSGKFFVIFLVVSASHVVRLLFSTARSSVDVFGVPNALCSYVITSSMFPSIITELICSLGVCICLDGVCLLCLR